MACRSLPEAAWQEGPRILADAIFRALPLIAPDESVIVGLPDTIWYPSDALAGLQNRIAHPPSAVRARSSDP